MPLHDWDHEAVSTHSDFDEATRTSIVRALRGAGARFAFLHGSRAVGGSRPDSDLDIAAWWGRRIEAWPDVSLPDRCDLVVLDRAPLWLAGRVALDGVLLFDDDPPSRVTWQADARLRYLDELPQMKEYAREYLEAVSRGRP